MKKITLLMAMMVTCLVAFAQQPELVLNDWDGNQDENYEFNLWSNPNCWCVWSSTKANPSTDGINSSDSCMSYTAHNWLDQQWWYYQEGMFGFKKLPTRYLQDHKYVYFEYLVGDDVSYSGVDSAKSSVGDTIRIKLKFAGATSADPITTDVLHEIIITEDDLYTWKAITLEMPETVSNADYTVLNVFTGANPNAEMEIEFYYDNFGLTNTEEKLVLDEGTIIEDWDGNQYPGYEFSIWSNPNCWCVWSSTVANPSTDGINSSDSCMYYPAHNWLDQNWWYYQEGMMGFKKLPTSYLQDHKYVYLEYLVGDEVEYAGADTSKTSVGDTIRMKLKFAGATSAEPLTTDVLLELIITEDDLNIWKTAIFEIPEAVQNADYTIMNVFTGANPSEEMEIEFYYDNVKLANEADPGTFIVSNVMEENDFSVFADGDMCSIRMNKTTMLKSAHIYNMAGSLMTQESLNYEAKEFSVPLNLHSGIYLIKLESGNDILTKKFIVR